MTWDKSKPTGDKKRIMDTQRARNELNFMPNTSLTEGLKKTVDWFLKNHINSSDKYNSFLEKNLMQKSVIIIGGSKHIGRNLVLSLAKEKWNILFTYSNNTNEAKATFEEANKYNQNIKMLKFNSAEILTSEGKKFRKAWGSTKFNNLCGLVYNVGNLGDTKKIIDIDIKNFKKLFDINFFPIVEFCKVLLSIYEKFFIWKYSNYFFNNSKLVVVKRPLIAQLRVRSIHLH